MLQVYTGMRIGEVVALNYEEDVDLENKLLHVTKNYDYKNKIYTTPKTGESRTLRINDETRQVIREQLNYIKRRTIQYKYDRTKKLLCMAIRQNPIS